MEINGKGAMVVGGASGMARSTAEALREAGAEVAILDRGGRRDHRHRVGRGVRRQIGQVAYTAVRPALPQ